MSRAPLDVPTMAHLLSTFAYHVSCLTTWKPDSTIEKDRGCVRFGLGLGSYGEGCPTAHVHVMIAGHRRDTSQAIDPWGVWADCYFEPMQAAWTSLPAFQAGETRGTWQGNRHGAVEAYTTLCAPVFAWVADYWAGKERTAKAA